MANNSNQFDDLPLPDMEASWQKMKELLDNKNDKKPLLPLTMRSCGVLCLLLILAGGGIWLSVKNYNSESDKIASAKSSAIPNRDQSKSIENDSRKVNVQTTENRSDPIETDEVINNNNGVLPKQRDINKSTINANSDSDQEREKSDLINKSGASKSIVRSSFNTKSVASGNKISNSVIPGKVSYAQNKDREDKNIFNNNKASEISIAKTNEDNVDSLATANASLKNEAVNHVSIPADSNKTVSNLPQAALVDTSIKKDIITQQTNTSLATATKPAKNKRFQWSAGISLQQQISIAKQKHIALNYNGKGSFLSDHTPSAYLKFEKKNKWFVQAEFRFAAPQSIEDFSYSRRTRLSDSSKVLSTTNYNLKKTFYHQVPLSFNYYVVPNLSIGLGLIYNRFQGAVTEQVVATKNFNTQQQSDRRQIITIKEFRDTFLYKTQLQYLLQAEYRLSRFTFGLRYTNDLEPYIKFTRPDGEILSRKNKTLQAMVRFRLWKGK